MTGTKRDHGRLTRALARSASRLMLRTARTPLGALWGLAHAGIMRGAAAYVRWGAREASVYLKGSFASGEPVYGISDIDLVVVTPGEGTGRGAAGDSIRRRWGRLERAIPPLSLLVPHFWIYEKADLVASTSRTCWTRGLEDARENGRGRGAGGIPPPPVDEMGLLERPGLYGIRREWRLLSGPERRPAEVTLDPQSRRIAAWLELQYWWRYAFKACAQPELRHAPYLCVKFLAEPVRILLWLERGERVASREDALARGLTELPEEDAAFRLALELSRALPRSPVPPLAEVLPAFLRLSRRVARHVDAAAEAAGWTEVRLFWGDESELALDPEAQGPLAGFFEAGGWPTLLPLADWRARVAPELPDETFALIEGDPARPSLLARAARASRSGVFPVLRGDGLLILPTLRWERGSARAVQCATTDPVSFALAQGGKTARFPRLAGWSAHDSALRAVLEHRVRLAALHEEMPPIRRLGWLFTAARAAIFLASVEDGVPELPLTIAAVAERLGARDETAGALAREAYESFRLRRRGGALLSPDLLSAFSRIVRELPEYAAPREVPAASHPAGGWRS